MKMQTVCLVAFCCLVAGARAEAGSYGVTGDIQRRIDAASRHWCPCTVHRMTCCALNKFVQ